MASTVTALEPEWRAALDEIARERGWPTSAEPAQLGALVAKLSEDYNAGRRAPHALAARLLFSFPRDVPKGAAAVRELVATGALELPSSRPLRVLDLGAGLGAATWGIARALSAARAAGATEGSIEATFVDDEPAALALAEVIARKRGGERGVRLSVRAHQGDAARFRPDGAYDVVVLSQALSEMDAARDEPARIAAHVELSRRLLAGALRDDGSLVLVEPALRERARHLHAVRDALLVERVANVFAPCLHDRACPALAQPGEWCHEDLPVDLPEWLVPVARAAGLRWQGLTFSYAVLRRDGDSLARRLGAERGVRVVSDRIVTKGKLELFVCGAAGESAARARLMRLDRHETPENRAMSGLRRGDVAVLEPAPELGRGAGPARVGAEMKIDVRTAKH
jgi:SAM-dependent methyltransferase